MLTQLIIRNFAVIESLNMPLQAGLTVLTGETGAGKSILVEAMGLVLGDRADSKMIRAPGTQAEIGAIFKIQQQHTELHQALDAHGIEYDDELVVRRLIYQSSGSRCFVNGSPLTLHTLKTLTEQLIDIHGQHEHQSLFIPGMQRQLLDAFGDHAAQLDAVQTQYQRWHSTTEELALISQAGADHNAQISLLEYQVAELDALALTKEEYPALCDTQERLSRMQEILEIFQSVLADLDESERPIPSILSRHLTDLQSIQSLVPSLDTSISLLDSATIQLSEARDELRAMRTTLDVDTEALSSVTQRLDKLHDIARKHNIKPAQLFAHMQKLTLALAQLHDQTAQIETLQKEQQAAATAYQLAAEDLHQARLHSAQILATQITAQIQTLGMQEGKFDIAITPQKQAAPTHHGLDQIQFLIAANPGQPLRPLSKAASGGELSRISLAIQVTGARDSGTQSMVFDEVDAGIGGQVAESVGTLLQSLSAQRQVFCITHLPQIAAFAKHHIKISKTTRAGQTYTEAEYIDDEPRRIQEIARMLAGDKLTKHSEAHAKEMLRSKLKDFSS